MLTCELPNQAGGSGVFMKWTKACLILFSLLIIAFSANAQNVRTEQDLLGEKQIPADAYYGVQTARALELTR
jgi:aspartate ammonia-lyase